MRNYRRNCLFTIVASLALCFTATGCAELLTLYAIITSQPLPTPQGGGPAGSPTVPPSVLNVTATTAEDTPLTVDVLTDESKVALVLPTLTLTVSTAPANGIVTIDPVAKTARYTPNPNFNGTDTFTIQVCNSSLPPLCATATVTITVTPVNDLPNAVANTGAVTEDAVINTAVGNVLTNDTDVEGTPLVVSQVAGVAANVGAVVPGTFGSVTINAAGAFTYTLDNALPAVQALAQGQTATDVFAYTASDGTATADSTLTITITGANDAPIAGDDTATTDEDTAVLINVAANDADVDGSLVATVTVTTPPANGTAVVNPANNRINYTPNLDYSGPDTFDYQICDNGVPPLCDAATVNITVNPVNDAPVNSVPGTQSVNEDANLTFSIPNGNQIVTSDVDLGANPVQVTLTATNGLVSLSGTAGLAFTTGSGTADATMTFTGTLAAVNNALNGLTFAPTANYNGPAGLTIATNDQGATGAGGPQTDTDTITINVNGTNDAPIANNDAAAITEDAVPNNVSGNILTNDTDVDTGDTKTVTQVNGIGANVGAAVAGTFGSVTINAVGAFTYTLDNANPAVQSLAAGQIVIDGFNYLMSDGSGATSASTLTITVTGANDTPTPNPDFNNVEEDVILTVSGNVLTNDTDTDTLDTLTVSAVNGSGANVGFVVAGTYGSVQIDGNGAFNYTLNNSAAIVQALAEGQIVIDQFTYTAFDGTAGAASQLSINVTGDNDAPVAVNDGPYSVTTGGTINVSAALGVLANDTDIDTGDSSDAVNPVNPSHASVFNLNANGSFDYTHDGTDPSAYGFTDTFTYQALDDAGSLSAPATVTISIQAGPAANDDAYTTAPDTPLVISAAAGVIQAGSPGAMMDTGNPAPLVTTYGPVGGPLATTPGNAFTLASGSTVNFAADGLGGFTYTPFTGFVGNESFDYEITNALGTSIATVTLTVSCPTITVNNPANTNGTAGSPFSETFTQTGATGAATFTTASTLPTGLTLATNGVLSGTPTQTGTFPIVVTVTDSAACTGTSATYNLTINCQTITVTNPANAAGAVNAPFSETFTQTSAIGTATFTTASTLPSGLTLATNGVLSGTPGQPGAFPVVVTVTDSNGCTGTGATYNLVIACQTITVTNPANTVGTVGTPFSETFTQTGAIGTATFTTASALPSPLTLSTSGVLSGTPGTSGVFPIVVTVTDSNGCTGTSATYNLTINQPPTAVADPNGGLPANSTPPAGANPHPYHTALNTAITVPDGANDLLANDNLGFPAADISSFGPNLAGVTTFTTFGSPVANATANNGTLTVNLNGSFTYTPPNATFTGLDTFAYRLTNAAGNSDALVTIAVGVRPVAAADAHAVTGNIQIDTSTGVPFSVLTNDFGDQKSASLNAVSGGAATVAGNGQFTFNPNAGLTGAASITYNLTNGFGTVTGTVNLTIANMVWFVKNDFAGVSDGRLTNPFTTLDAAEGASPSGVTFVYNTGANYSGDYFLDASERLLGQSIAFTNANLGFTPADHSVNLPTVAANPTTTGLIFLASNCHVRGIDISYSGAPATTALQGNGAAGVTVDTLAVSATNRQAIFLNNCGGTIALTGVTVSNSDNAAVGLVGNSASINLGAFNVNNTTGQPALSAQNNTGTITTTAGTITSSLAIFINGPAGLTPLAMTLTSVTSTAAGGNTHGTFINQASGSFAVTGTTSISNASSRGVELTNNTAAINLGTLNITSASTTGLLATNNTGTITTTAGTINTGSGTAINIDGPAALTPLAMTLTSVTSNGSSTGISLTETSGSFTVTGDGTTTAGGNASGGTIQNTTGDAIVLNGMSNVTLRNMTITNPTGHGINADNLNGVNLFQSLTAQNFDVLNTDGITVDQTVNFTSITLDRSLFTDAGAHGGNDGFRFVALSANSAAGTVNVTNSVFTELDGDGIQVNNDGSGTITTTITGNNLHTADTTGGGNFNTLSVNLTGNGVLNATIGGAGALGNTLNDVARVAANAGALSVAVAGPAALGGSDLNATIENNTITNIPNRRGINVQLEASAANHTLGHDITIKDNNIQNTVNRQGIYVEIAGITGVDNQNVDLSITGNLVGTVTPVGNAARPGIHIQVFDDFATAGTALEADILMQNNQVRVNNTGDVVRIETGAGTAGGAANVEATLLGNTFTNDNAGGLGFNAEVGFFVAGTNTFSLDMNSANVPANGNTSIRGYVLNHDKATNPANDFNVEVDGVGLSGAGPFTDAQVEIFFNARNTGTVTTPANSNDFTGVASVTQP